MNFLEKEACKFGWIYESERYLTALILVSAVAPEMKNKLKMLIIGKLLIFIVLNIKKYLKTERPCQALNYTKCCPSSFDTPSGHSALGVFHGLLCIKYGYKYLGYFFLLQPLSRIVGKQHSLTAVLSGSLLGYVFYLIYEKTVV